MVAAALMVILVTVVEKTMVVVHQDLEAKVVNRMIEEEGAMVVTMKEGVLVEVATVLVGTTMS